MVVGYDITVRADDDARTCSFTLRGLYLLLASASLFWITEESEWVEESSERIALYVYSLYLRVLYVLDMYNGRQSLFCSEC